ncbi:hypothetical protein CPB83DRAFT_848377 [Crepidotus variabilis]|uniref:Uncharacterized protein n=1 Tax=Crepidotus variabilis TaxID=179855 RepID=A0A9P6EN94_9AGAR|nr:hypothetical protein CPB83DRAFT_848377 [Crepidotus variabilis]
MPRPRPLTNVSSAVPYQDEHQLTPRTPRSASGSRTSRLEQGFAKVQLTEANENEFDEDSTLQSAPLLASSSTAHFSAHPRGPTSAKDGRKDRKKPPAVELLSLAVSRIPLAIGIFASGILLILIVLSFTRPEVLHRYVGAKAPNATASANPKLASGSKPVHAAESEKNIHLISYENYTTFPLHPLQYAEECAKLHQGYMSHGDYWDISHMGPKDVQHSSDSTVCSSTITYMLSGLVGLSADLALMAQVAALAREQNRTFFIDDRYWDRGKWTDHFEDIRKTQPGPNPGCKPPPANELVACPRTARHWVVNSRTAVFHLGHEFSNHYEDPYAHNLNRLKPMFESAHTSLTTTIIPSSENKAQIELARKWLSSHLQDGSKKMHGLYIATHIRRGDRKTSSYQFADRKVPMKDYVEAVTTTWGRLHFDDIHPPVYLATDSPAAYRQFIALYQGPVFSLYDAPDSSLRSLASPAEYSRETFDQLELKERVIATRGMIVDLAIVGGLWAAESDLHPDAVICTISSNVCRLAPVGMGWENAFGHVDATGDIDITNVRWIDVDQKGQMIPVWEAFELF